MRSTQSPVDAPYPASPICSKGAEWAVRKWCCSWTLWTISPTPPDPTYRPYLPLISASVHCAGAGGFGRGGAFLGHLGQPHRRRSAAHRLDVQGPGQVGPPLLLFAGCVEVAHFGNTDRACGLVMSLVALGILLAALSSQPRTSYFQLHCRLATPLTRSLPVPKGRQRSASQHSTAYLEVD